MKMILFSSIVTICLSFPALADSQTSTVIDDYLASSSGSYTCTAVSTGEGQGTCVASASHDDRVKAARLAANACASKCPDGCGVPSCTYTGK